MQLVCKHEIGFISLSYCSCECDNFLCHLEVELRLSRMKRQIGVTFLLVCLLFVADCGREAVGSKWTPREQRIPCGSSHAQLTSSPQPCEFNWLLCWWRSTPSCLWVYALRIFGGSFAWYFIIYLSMHALSLFSLRVSYFLSHALHTLGFLSWQSTYGRHISVSLFQLR